MRLCVHVTQHWGHCVHCSWSSRHAVFPVLRALGIEFTDVEGADLPTHTHTEPLSLPKDFMLLTHATDDLDQIALDYILKRGVTLDQIRRYRIGASFSGRFAYRIVFPIYADHKLKSLIARDFTGTQKPKYLLSTGDKYLWAFDPKASTCVLSEGVIKAARIQRVSHYNSAALLGHNLTPTQLEQLSVSACKTIILYPDPDAAGRNGAATIATQLSEAFPDRNIQIVWPIDEPADESELRIIQTNLAHSVAYSWNVHQQLKLGAI